MSTKPRCVICAGPLSTVLRLPNFPLTGLYSRRSARRKPKGIDQEFLFCSSCRHGQLLKQVPASQLYNKNYSFLSGQSETGRSGTAVFLSFLKKVAGRRRFSCVMDVGCNDLYLLDQLKERARIRVGVDPVWAGRHVKTAKDLTVIGDTVENMGNRLPAAPDLIVCRHTLEHIADPRPVLEKLFSAASPDALFVFEMPRLEPLVAARRFDQIFHHHLQYFSLNSFQKLIQSVGGRIVKTQDNPPAWGAMLVAFKRGKGQAKFNSDRTVTKSSIIYAFNEFQLEMKRISRILLGLKSFPLYGYGAAQLLPVLAYFLKSDLRMLKGVLDDDAQKWGLSYQNLPLKILKPAQVKDFQRAGILLTALDNATPILKRIKGLKPALVVTPLIHI